MSEITNANHQKFDLEDRTALFAKRIRTFSIKVAKNLINIDDLKQLIRSSGSVAANYIEANESLTKKEFLHRIGICRKEAKESQLWLKLVVVAEDFQSEREILLDECLQLTKIFGSIIQKCK